MHLGLLDEAEEHFERGVAYSEVLDGAGHLQKRADVDGVLLSQATLDALEIQDYDYGSADYYHAIAESLNRRMATDAEVAAELESAGQLGIG